MRLPEQVWAGGEPPSRRRRLVTGGAGPTPGDILQRSLLPLVQAHPAGPLSWPDGHVDPLPRLGRTHEHISLKLWVSELGLLIRRRCPQELDVKGSPLRLSGALFSPRPPSGQPRAPICGSVHTSEHPVRAAEARTPPPLTVFAPTPVAPTKAPIPLT